MLATLKIETHPYGRRAFKVLGELPRFWQVLDVEVRFYGVGSLSSSN